MPNLGASEAEPGAAMFHVEADAVRLGHDAVVAGEMQDAPSGDDELVFADGTIFSSLQSDDFDGGLLGELSGVVEVESADSFF